MPHDKNPIEQSPEIAEFWQAARERRLLLKRCGDCGERHFYPRPYCPFCGSARTSWEQSSGRGTIYAFSRPRKMPQPLAVAVIELQEGVRLTSVIVDTELDRLAIGQAVEVYWRMGEPAPELAFTTIEA